MSTLAYIDPMSGAIVLQLIVAGLAGGLAYFRRGILGAWRSVFRGGSPSDPVG